MRAGTFECFKVEFSIAQTFWVSTAPDRRVVKFEANGVTGELTGSRIARSGGPQTFEDAELGFAVTAPDGWDFWVSDSDRTDAFVPLALLDPEARFLSVLEVRRAGEGETSLVDVARRELDGAKDRVTNFALRTSSWSERLDGTSPAVSFVGDFDQAGKKMVQYRVYAMQAGRIAEFVFRTEREEFEALRPTLEGIASSFRAGTEPR